jgi:hypothetical protein
MSLSDDPAVDASGAPLAELVLKFADIAGTREIGARLVLAADAIFQETRARQATVLDVERIIFGALDEPFPNIVRHPKAVLLQRLLTDEAAMTDDEVEDVLHFVASHVAVKMQGEVAELLALRMVIEQLVEWRQTGTVPPTARVICGRGIRMRVIGRNGWYKGVDGLIGVWPDGEDGPPAICGTIEIKSYQPSWRNLRKQVRNNLTRLQQGIRIEGNAWAGERLTFLGRDRTGWAACPIGQPPPALPAILVAAERSGRAARRHPPDFLTVLTLDLPYDALVASGHALVVWLLEKMGERIYAEPSLRPDGMEPEDAAINALNQALYSARMRPLSKEGHSVAEKLYHIHAGPGTGAEAIEPFCGRSVSCGLLT